MGKRIGLSSAAVEAYVGNVISGEVERAAKKKALAKELESVAPSCQYETWHSEPNDAEDRLAFPHLIRRAGGELVALAATDQLCEESKDEARLALICAAPQLLAHLNMLLFAIENSVKITTEHAAYIVGSEIAKKAMGVSE